MVMKKLKSLVGKRGGRATTRSGEEKLLVTNEETSPTGMLGEVKDKILVADYWGKHQPPRQPVPPVMKGLKCPVCDTEILFPDQYVQHRGSGLKVTCRCGIVTRA